MDGIAIVGMAGRFPGARNVAEFWAMLSEGRDGISFFPPEELPAGFVPATATVSDVDKFDSEFFQYNPREAEMIDPQQRLFLESCWSALENAGHDPLGGNRSIGVFSGCSLNTYLLQNLLPRLGAELSLAGLQAGLASDKDFLSTRVSYKLNLQGPSLTVQSACSTSLVAVHLAVQSLLLGECDMALAGGSSIRPNNRGYEYEEGSILSPEGRCRPFDHRALGTIPGNGVGVVLLKRVDDAIADRNTIYAVIKGTAVNNDGAMKIGYTAPNVEGQAKVIAEALAVAEVEGSTIGYVETHGTGTPLGDPIEITALDMAHGDESRQIPCALGALKSAVGHMDAAAGIGGLIKAALALHHRQIPPNPYFEAANPKLSLESTRFFVNREGRDWTQFPRRAGVSSFGMGGTNAHAILEEAPSRSAEPSARRQHLVVMSALTEPALDRITQDLVYHLNDQPLADVAYTLQVGRHPLKFRRVVVGTSIEDIRTALAQKDPAQVFTHPVAESLPKVFLFPGQGAQYPGMGRALYREEPVFRAAMDRCAAILAPTLGADLLQLIYPEGETACSAAAALEQTWITQPALFAVEYSLAQLWKSWGIVPDAMVGHSVGEYVAACLAGVFSLEDGLQLVAARGRLIHGLPAGSMLSVNLPVGQLPEYTKGLSLAAVNAPTRCVLSGEGPAVDSVELRLREDGIECRRLKTSHAFHSEMLDPILPPFLAMVEKVSLRAPKIPFVSNVTGTWITAEQATSPAYWAGHARGTVHFGASIANLVAEAPRLFIEVGPGRTLSAFTKMITECLCLNTLPHPQEVRSDSHCALTALGRIWASTSGIDLGVLYAQEARNRLPLPTYSFEKRRHWIDLPSAKPAAVEESVPEAISGTSALSELEDLVGAEWKRALGIVQIGPRDNFFEIGGDSMVATQIVNRLKAQLQLSFPVSLLLQSPSISAFASALEEKLLADVVSESQSGGV